MQRNGCNHTSHYRTTPTDVLSWSRLTTNANPTHRFASGHTLPASCRFLRSHRTPALLLTHLTSAATSLPRVAHWARLTPPSWPPYNEISPDTLGRSWSKLPPGFWIFHLSQGQIGRLQVRPIKQRSGRISRSQAGRKAVLFFRLAGLSCSGPSIDSGGFFCEIMDDTPAQTSMGVGHLEPDTSSDDFAEDVCRTSARREDAEPVSLALANISNRTGNPYFQTKIQPSDLQVSCQPLISPQRCTNITPGSGYVSLLIDGFSEIVYLEKYRREWTEIPWL